MSNNTPAETTTTPAQPHFGVQRIYTQGQSLEMPAGSKLFMEPSTPDLNLALQVSISALAEGIFEVTLRGTLTGSVKGKPAYLVEVDQTGIFEVRNATPELQANMLEIGAPTLLAPYLRAQIADVLSRATLPPFFMPEINWAGMAQEQRAKAAAATNGTDAPAAPAAPGLLH